MYNIYSWSQQEQPQLHNASASPTLCSRPKSTPAGDIVTYDLLGWRLSTGGCYSHAAVTTASLRASQHVFADLPVCPNCRLPCRTQKGQGCRRNDLCFSLLTCERSRTQRQTRELWGKIWQLFVFLFFLFFVVVTVFRSSLSLISHALAPPQRWTTAPRGQNVEVVFSCSLVVSIDIFADEQHQTLALQNQHIHSDQVLLSSCVCALCFRLDLVSCSSFKEDGQNRNGTLLLLYKLCCNDIFIKIAQFGQLNTKPSWAGIPLCIVFSGALPNDNFFDMK